MEIVTIQKHVHTSPRKLKLVADMVRKMKPVSALNTLRFTNKAAAEPLEKAIRTVLANAHQQNLSDESLSFKALEINEGPSGRRYRAGTRGRAKPYKKRTSHIRIVLTNESIVKEEPVKETKKTVKKEAKKVEEKETK